MNKTAAALLLMSVPSIIGCGGTRVVETRDAYELVAALGDPSNEARAAAAASLRRLLAADPSARTNDHGREYWQRRVAAVKPGMKHAEVVKLLPPSDTTRSLDQVLWSGGGPATGSCHRAAWGLDHYWSVEIEYINPDIVRRRPTLKSGTESVSVMYPQNYTGTWAMWYVNGQKYYEYRFLNGKMHGACAKYYDNGRKRCETHYRNGMAHGSSRTWHRTGKLHRSWDYLDGKVIGHEHH
ncbi:MAG: toxin-antitoxin system YwqK family antitoxin [Planctomycetota bacterium]|jgi:hypothetical protein